MKWSENKLWIEFWFKIHLLKKSLGKKLFFSLFFAKVKQPRKNQPQSKWFSIAIFFQYMAETVFHMSSRPLCKFKLNRTRLKPVPWLDKNYSYYSRKYIALNEWVTDLDQQSEMIIFEYLLTTFEVSIVF